MQRTVGVFKAGLADPGRITEDPAWR